VAETAPAAPEPKAAAPAAVDHYKEGKALLKDNKALLAIEEFKKAIAKNARHAKAYRMMGKAYIILGQESKAIESFEKFVELAPNHKDSEKLRAIIEQFRNR
jgi:tetratricopeptide (TPR) repeat protein